MTYFDEDFCNEEPRPLICDRVSAELLLETLRAINTLRNITQQIDVPYIDGETQKLVKSKMSQLDFVFRMIPSVLDYRRMICFGDCAADHPEWWKANRLHFFEPGLTNREIAGILDLAPHQVRDAIRAAEIPADCYEQLPKINKQEI